MKPFEGVFGQPPPDPALVRARLQEIERRLDELEHYDGSAPYKVRWSMPKVAPA